MGREIKRLSARTVATVSEPGRYADGAGLYLIVDEGGAKRWLLFFSLGGKRREMGLGNLHSVSLALARDLAAEARDLVARGVNPILQRKTAALTVPTFGAFADEVRAGLEPQWSNEKHRYQWRLSLETYAAPIRSKPVNEITTDDLLGVLRPIWTTKSETASRTRGRIELVLDAARAKGLRTGENPARWRGHLDRLLPRRQRLTRGHHPALPYADAPDFMARLRVRNAFSAVALEFIILTAARSGEALEAKWSEIDFRKKVWVVPAERMKMREEHRVPLSVRALEVLEVASHLRRDDDYIFPGQRRGRPLTGEAVVTLLQDRMDVKDATVHGFRSTFRDWAGDCTNFPKELIEAALAHKAGDETEVAYRRSDALERRRKLMEAWASYCLSAGSRAKVVHLKLAKA